MCSFHILFLESSSFQHTCATLFIHLIYFQTDKVACIYSTHNMVSEITLCRALLTDVWLRIVSVSLYMASTFNINSLGNQVLPHSG